MPLIWGEEAETPEAAARYSVKLKSNDPNVFSLFDLAARDMTAQVGEYLHAVQGRRLRATSRKLTDVLHLSGSGEEDETLLALADAAPGQIVGEFTHREWCARW